MPISFWFPHSWTDGRSKSVYNWQGEACQAFSFSFTGHSQAASPARNCKISSLQAGDLRKGPKTNYTDTLGCQNGTNVGNKSNAAHVTESWPVPRIFKKGRWQQVIGLSQSARNYKVSCFLLVSYNSHPKGVPPKDAYIWLVPNETSTICLTLRFVVNWPARLLMSLRAGRVNFRENRRPKRPRMLLGKKGYAPAPSTKKARSVFPV